MTDSQRGAGARTFGNVHQWMQSRGPETLWLEPRAVTRAPSGDFDKILDAASYDPVAEVYGHYINRLSAPLARHAVKLCRLEPGHRVLDVGTGTGIAARYAALAVAPTGQAFGIDLSAGMISVARVTALNEGAGNVAFDVMDAESLLFPDHSFDCVLSLCAVAHFPQLGQTLAEMRRVMKPAGRLVVAIGAGRPNLSTALIPYATTRLIRLASGWFHPRLWAPHCMERFVSERVPWIAEPEETTWSGGTPFVTLPRHVRAAGFQRVRTDWVGHVVTFENAEAFWDAQVSIITSVRKRLAQLPQPRLAELRSEFVALAQRALDLGGELIYPYGAFYVTAVAPR